MRYRPFGQARVSVSAIALTVDDRAAERGGDALAALIFAAMEAGVNAFHIESREPGVLDAVGRSLAAVERRLLFVSLRLGLGSERAPTVEIERALDHTGLGRLDLVLLDAPGEDEAPATALAALEPQRASGRVGLLGVAGAHDAMDAYLGARGCNVLASPYHPGSGWKELNRLKAAAHRDMGVIAYDYFPERFRQASTTPGVPQKRSLFDALAGAPELHPLAGAGTYAFLHDTRSWTAEELCLACALMEPSVSTVLIRAHELERLEALAAVPDRDLPPGLAAKVEMARFGLEQEAAEEPSAGGVFDALKGMIPHLEVSDIFGTYGALKSKVADAFDELARIEAPSVKVRPKSLLRHRGAARPRRRADAPSAEKLSAETWARLLPTPRASLSATTVTPLHASSGAERGETPGLPPVDATPAPPPPAAQPSAAQPSAPQPSAPQPSPAQPQTAIWRSKDYDYPVQPTGESFPGPDGRIYLKVDFDGSQTFVPADEMIFPEEATPPQPAPVERDAPQARDAAAATEARGLGRARSRRAAGLNRLGR